MAGVLLNLTIASAPAHSAETAAPVTATPAAAQKVTFDIAPQPLGDALRQFGQQTGLQVVLYSNISKGLQAPHITGELTPQVALEQLLAKTGLRYEYLNSL